MDSNEANSAEVANTKPMQSISKIWLVPIVALGIGIWMAYFQLSNQGPLITITFSATEGLEAGKTKIKTRFVDVGTVTAIRLDVDSSRVIVTARMNVDAEHLLREDTNMWIVTPRVSISGVSGLSTILSGPYIELAPGMSGNSQYDFEGLDEPPITPAGTPGLHVTLNSQDEFAYGEGDPIVYKGLKVGQIEDVYFNIEERTVYYNAFIKAPYHELITTTTRFWDTSGVRLDLKADGLSFHTGSIETLLTNGVAFGIPYGADMGVRITERDYFDIHANYEEAEAQRYTESAEYILMVEDTVRGLRYGAPVEYRGVQIGQVLEVNVDGGQPTTLLEEYYKIPVKISIQPGRVGLSDDEAGVALVKQQTELWMRKGFRATLSTGNILTGALFVDLKHHEEAEEYRAETFLGYDVIPVISTQFNQITRKITAILDQVNALPFDDLASNVNETLVSFKELAETFKSTGGNLDKLLTSAQEEQLISQLNATIRSFESLSQDYSKGSDAYRELNQTMQTLQQTMTELKPLLLQLNYAPNSLLFGVGEKEPLEPKAKGENNE